jgi:hypothetical protein
VRSGRLFRRANLHTRLPPRAAGQQQQQLWAQMASNCCAVDNYSKRVGAPPAAFHTLPMLPRFPVLPIPQAHQEAKLAPRSNHRDSFSWFSSHDRSKTMGISMAFKSSLVASSERQTTAVVQLESPRIPSSSCHSQQHPVDSFVQSSSASIPIVRRQGFFLEKEHSDSSDDGSYDSNDNAEYKEHCASNRLERIYDQRTWAMYTLITNARKRMVKCSVVQAASIQSMSDSGYSYSSFRQHNHLTERSQCCPRNMESENDSDYHEDEEDHDEDTCLLTSYSWDNDMVFELEDFD